MDYFWPCVLFIWVTYIWELYLTWRQRRVYQTVDSVPDEAKQIMDQDTLEKSRRYQLDKSTFSLCHDLFSHVEFTLILFLGGMPYAWDLAGGVCLKAGRFGPEYEITQSVVFLLVMLVYSELVGLPWKVYSTFVVEERHGFNKQTPAFFIKDQIKSLMVSSVLMSLILSGLIAVIQYGGSYFYIYAWIFTLIVTLVLSTIYPDYIAPLFDKYTLLPEGELRVAIEHLASKLQFPLKKIYVVENSKRSAHSNAYFYGFWKNKRVVLFDTLLQRSMLPDSMLPDDEKTEGKEKVDGGMEGEKVDGGKEGEKNGEKSNEGKEDGGEEEKSGEGEDGDEGKGEREEEAGECEGEKKAPKKPPSKGCTMDEVLAVLAHEFGHWKLNHTLKLLGITQVNLIFVFFVFGHFMNQEDVYRSFGFVGCQPVLIGLIIVLQLFFTPYNLVFSFLMIQLSRSFEYQADRFAKQMNKTAALRSGLIKLYKENLSFPVADWLYSSFRHSHPILLERLQALREKQD